MVRCLTSARESRYTDLVAGDADAGGVARAGAQFAARRKELGISQRKLASMRIISAPALIAFEKGRAWPRDKTRATLEKVVQWPPGTLARLSAGTQAPASDAKGSSATQDSAALLSGAVALAAQPVFASVEILPPADDPAFVEQAGRVLADLRQLESLTARAVRTSQGSAEVIKLLRDVRQRYDQVMSRAAAAPGATLGQRLYAARSAAAFSTAEAAGAAGVAPDVVMAVESEETISEDAAARIEALIRDLSG